MLFKFFVFITLILISEQQSIKLKPVYLSETTAETRLTTKTQILISFDRNKHKRLQLVPSASKLSNQIQQSVFFINNTELSLNANLSSTFLDREYLLDENQCFKEEEIVESDCVLRLKVAAYDIFNQMQSMYIVPVVVMDLNDQRPQFRHTLYRVNISENLLSVTHIPLDTPFDSDSTQNGVKQCEIESHTNKLFEAFFNRDSQRLFLVVNRPLDRENISQYDLILMCTDGVTFARTRLHIDVLDANDNQPYFKQNFTLKQISENSNEKVIANVEAHDYDDATTPNGQLVFSLPFELNSNDINLFEINEQNGSLSVRFNASLDYEKKSKYNLKVKVQDQGANSVPAYADVQVALIDENDNPPQGQLTFSDKFLMKQDKLNNTIWIYEELPPNQTTLAYLTLTDADTPSANGFSLGAQLLNHTQMFKLVPIIEEYDNLYYALQLINRIDREQFSQFDLTFKLADNFNSSQNQQITYLNLRVILLDVNDNKPQFQNLNSNQMYQFDLSENKLYSRLTQVKAIDLDLDQQLRYDIVPLTPESLLPPFEINSVNGDLKLVKELDREEASQYAFKIRCSDQGQLFTDALVQVNVIDENDNLPIFLNWQPSGVQFDLDEEQPAQTLIGNVRALDADLNSSMFYFLKPDAINNYFQISNSTGNLVTKIKLDADLAKQKTPYSLASVLVNNTKFVFDIIAVDLDRPLSPQLEKPLREQKLKVEIYFHDLNDNKPVVVTSLTPNVTLVNLNQTNCTNNSMLVTTLTTIDMDRDFSKAPAQNRHYFRLSYIKRLSWSSLYEITKQVNQTYASLIQSLAQLKQEHKSIMNVNLRQIFAIKHTNSLLGEETNLNRADLMLKKTCEVNTGVYLFGVQILDRSTDVMQRSTQMFESKRKKQYWRTEFQFRNYLLNSTTSLFSQEELDQLNSVVDAWWSRQQHSNDILFDDNGDDQESQISLLRPLARGILFTSNSSTFSLVSHLKHYFIANSSYSIITVISFFLCLALVLVSLISYKYYKASANLLVKDTKLNSTLTTDETNSTNSDTCLHKPGSNQTSSSTTASTNLSLNEDLTKQNYASPSSSFFESYCIQPTSTITEHQIKCLVEQKDDEERVNTNVSDSSFTVITTSSITPVSALTTTILASASQTTSSPKKAVLAAYNNNNNKQQQAPVSPSSSAFLSTFQLQAYKQTNECIAIVEHDNDDEDDSLVRVKSTNLSNDHGYCGSSDYSDNSILTKNSSSVSRKQMYKQQQHRPAKYVTNKAFMAGSQTEASSSSSSSPLFNCNSNVNRPTITNLYPPCTFNSNNFNLEEDAAEVVERTKTSSSTSTTNTTTNHKTDSVKVYLERFERIYNASQLQENATTNQRTTNFKNASYSYV